MLQNSKHPNLNLLLIILIIIVGAVIRLDVLYSSNFIIESDEAIVGLMAKRWLEGIQSMPIFYYGQHYMGSLEPFFVAILSLFIGISTVSLKLVPLIFSLVFIYLIYKLTLEVTNNKQTAFLAMLLSAISPSALTIWSSKPRGGFIEVMVIGTLALLYFIRWLKFSKNYNLYLASFFLGLGWWVNNQIIYYILPCFFVACIKLIKNFKNIPSYLVSIFLFLVGSSLYWYYNLKENFASFQIFSSSSKTNILGNFKEFFLVGLPIIQGAERVWQDYEFIPGAKVISFSIIIALFIHFMFLDKQSIFKIKNFLTFEKTNLYYLLFLQFLTVPLVFCFSSFGNLALEPRYLLPLYSSYFVLLAILLNEKFGNLKIVRNLLITLIITLQFLSNYYGGIFVPKEPFVYEGERVSEDHSELISWLQANKIKHINTNYWIGYRLAFETNEEVQFKVFSEPYQIRIPEYEEAFKEESLVYVVTPAQAIRIKDALKILKYKFKTKLLSGYVVFYNLKEVSNNYLKISNKEFTAVSNYANEQLYNIFDNNLATRWGSGSPQNSSMYLKIDFTKPNYVSSINYKFGQWYSDYPRGLEVIVTLANGKIKKILSNQQYFHIRYFISESDFKIYIQQKEVIKIELKLIGEHPILDWSIAELEIFGN